MAQKGSWLRLATAARLIRFARLLDAHFAARSDSHLPIDDNLLTGGNTLFDDNQVALALAQRHWSLFRRRVLLDDVDIRAFRGHLRRGGGNQHGAVNCAEHQANVHEPSRPEAMV